MTDLLLHIESYLESYPAIVLAILGFALGVLVTYIIVELGE